jgi:hypothetical protein
VQRAGTMEAQKRQTPMRALLIALAACAASATAAPSTDPLHSTACVNAMSAVRDAENAVVASIEQSKGSSATDNPSFSKLADIKRDAARTCLGGRGSISRAPRHVGQKPISVAPIAVSESPSGPRLPPHPAAPLPPVSVPPLKTVVSCDAVGCWVSDGTRLQKFGGGLFGPTGFCSVQGAVLTCP